MLLRQAEDLQKLACCRGGLPCSVPAKDALCTPHVDRDNFVLFCFGLVCLFVCLFVVLFLTKKT